MVLIHRKVWGRNDRFADPRKAAWYTHARLSCAILFTARAWTPATPYPIIGSAHHRDETAGAISKPRIRHITTLFDVTPDTRYGRTLITGHDLSSPRRAQCTVLCLRRTYGST